MKKSDLKNGAVVELRNGDRYLKVDNTLLDLTNDGGFNELNDYNEELICCHENNSQWDIMKVNNDTDNGFGFCNEALYQVKRNIWTWERPEEILGKAEKEYLSAVIKPFRDRVEYIEKVEDVSSKDFFIFISLDAGGICLPHFTKPMYKSMEIYKHYKLEELGL